MSRGKKIPVPAEERLTYDVPEAGRLAGLGRDSAYNAVKRGEMPIVKIGNKFLVPKKKWDAILNGEVV